MPNLGVTDQSTVALFEVIIWDIALLILLNDGVSSKVDCVFITPIWHIYFLTLPHLKGNISAVKLVMVTNKVSYNVVNQKEYALQCYTIQ